MKKLYQRTFEQVLAQTCPPLNRVEEQRRALASRCSHTESEVTAMTTKPRRPIRILVAAAAVAAALTAGALAASGALGSISLLSGGAFTSTDSVNWNEPDAGATVAPSQEHVCFPVREEPDLLTVRGGSVYFTTETGEELDITGQFSEAEPYVYSSNIFGPESDKFGLANVSWLTGTAAWMYLAATQYLLGVRPTWDGLEIDPCLPEQLLPAKVTRVFRGCRYEITITKNQKLLLPHVDRRKQLTVTV